MEESDIKRIADLIREESENVSFLSEIYLPIEDVVMIRENAGNLIFKRNDDDTKILVAYYLVDLGVRKYDNSYWPHLSEETGMKLIQSDHMDAYAMFSDALKILGMDASENVTTKRYIEKILIHTLVPDKKEYIDKFFNFISKYYKSILEYEIPDDYETRFEELSDYVKAIDEKNYQPTEFQIDENYPDPRSLNACTRYALMEPSLFKGLLLKILRMIDAGYCNRGDVDLLNCNRYAEPFKEWYQENIGKKSSQRLMMEKRSHRPHMVLNSSSFKPALVIPARQCAKSTQIEFIVKGKIVKAPNQPQTISLPGTSSYRMLRDITCTLDSVKLTPFTKFTVKLGEKEIYVNNPRKKWKAFDEDYSEVQYPSTGISYFIFEDKEYNPKKDNPNVDFDIDSGIYYAQIEDGTEINILGETILVTDSNRLQNEDRVYVNEIEGVKAQNKETGEYIPVINDDRIRCRLIGSFKKSVVIAEIRLDDKFFTIPIKNIKNNNNSIDFVIGHEAIKKKIFSEIEIAVKVDGNKKCSCKYLLIKEFNFKFDAKNGQYTDVKQGTLYVDAPVETTVQIDTSAQTQILSNYMDQSKYDLVFDVPSIFISYGGDSEWKSPGNYDVSIEKFYGDSLTIRCTENIRLYSKGFPPFEQTIKDGDFVFDTSQFKEKIENGKNYDVDFSIRSKARTRLFTVFTCNDYKINAGEKLIIEMKKNTDHKSYYKLCNHSADISHGELSEGENTIPIENDCYCKLEIFESPTGHNKMNKVKEQSFGPPYDLVFNDKGIHIYYNDEDIQIDCNKTENDFKTKYQSISRFNPWMKNVNADNYLKLIKAKR